MLERNLVKKIVNKIEKAGGIVYKIHGGEFQEKGIPDLYCACDGLSFWIEVKVKDNIPTPIQLHQMGRLVKRKVVAFWVNDSNWETQLNIILNNTKKDFDEIMSQILK